MSNVNCPRDWLISELIPHRDRPPYFAQLVALI